MAACTISFDTGQGWEAGVMSWTDVEKMALGAGEVVNAASLAFVRLLLPDTPDVVPCETSVWLSEFLAQQANRLVKSRDQSIIEAGSLDSKQAVKSKHPAVYGVLNVKSPAVWPTGFDAVLHVGGIAILR